MQLTYVFSELRNGLRRNISMTLAAIVTIFVSLTLVGMGLLLNAQAHKAEEYWGSKLQITVFLCNQNSVTANCVDGEVTAATSTPLRTTSALTVPAASGTVQVPGPAGTLQLVVVPPTVTCTVAGAVRKVSASTVSRAGLLPARRRMSRVCGKLGRAATRCQRCVTKTVSRTVVGAAPSFHCAR